MRLKKEFKPSFHKANARYRGVTEHSQYTNFILESVRDFLQLSHIFTGNVLKDMIGHQNAISHNFAAIMTGDYDIGKANLFSASTLNIIHSDREIKIPELSEWPKLSGCNVKKNGTSYIITSDGLKPDVGIYTTLYVEPGDVLYIRLKVKSASGAPDFSFGSNNKRVDPITNGDTRKVQLPKAGDYQILDYIVRFDYQQSVSLNINVHEKPNTLKASSIEVKELKINYMKEKSIALKDYHTQIKPELNEIEDTISSMK